MKPRHALYLAAMLLLGACAAMPKIVAGPVTVKGAMTVVSDGSWNRFDLPGQTIGENWTTDGLTLDVLTFYAGIKDGDGFTRIFLIEPRKPPAFRASMLPNEIVELYETTVTRDGSTFKLERLTPAQFAGAPGFRFEFSGTRKSDDVAMRGFGYGTVVKERLYLITYRAPRIHYYAKHLPRAEATARSAQIKP